MSFRDNLQYLRSKRHMTQEQLAMLLGVTRQSISKWESEKAYPEMDKLLMICDLFGCTLDDLVLGDVRHPGQTVAGGGQTNIAQSSSASVGFVGAGRQMASISDSFGMPVPSDGIGAVERPQGAVDVNGRSGTAGGPADNASDTGNAGQAGVFNASVGSSNSSDVVGEGAKDVTGYDAEMKGFAWKIAAGVMAMVVGVAFCSGFGDHGTPLTDTLSFIFIACGVVVGLPLILIATSSRRDFMRRHPYVENFYSDGDYAHANGIFIACLVAGIAEASIGIAVSQLGYLLLGIGDDDGGWPMVVMMLLFALATGSFIYGALRRSMLKVERYNRRCERREDWRGEADRGFVDLKEGSNGQADSDAGSFGHSRRFYARISGAVDGIIMLVATLIGMLMLFLGGDTAMGPGVLGVPFWLVWPIGGIVCAIADVFIHLVYVGNRRD